MQKATAFAVASGHTNRGNWHSFEPVASMVERYVDAFASSMPLYIRQMAEIARKSA